MRRWLSISCMVIWLVLITLNVSATQFTLQYVLHAVPLDGVIQVTAVGVHTHTDDTDTTTLYIDGVTYYYEVDAGTCICPKDLIWVYDEKIVNVIHVGGNCE